MACILAFLKGTDANLDDMVRHLEITREEVYEPFMRLVVNRVFARAKNDTVLMGTTHNSEFVVSADRTRNAWASIAGIASGFTGLRES